MSIDLLLYVSAFVCFVASGLNVPAPVKFDSLGFACLTATLFVS